jgi:hypothetical protein
MSAHFRHRRLVQRHVVVNADWVLSHRGQHSDVFMRYKEFAKEVGALGKDELVERTPDLMRILSDERMLRDAFDYLAANGGKAPGPDGMSYGDYSESDTWDLCRLLRDEIQDGSYEPGEERTRRVQKVSGKGFRRLTIQNVEDRIVQRVSVSILQPLFDPGFARWSFGFRPGRRPGMLWPWPNVSSLTGS